MHKLKQCRSTREAATEVVHGLVENFQAIHFVAGMGIGITSNVLYTFPIEVVRRGFHYVGLVYFFINLAVVAITHLLFLLKYIVFPKMYPERYPTTFWEFVHDGTKNVFLGASSMSITTIVNMMYLLRPNWWKFVWSIWWLNFVQAISNTLIVFFFIFSSSTSKEFRHQGKQVFVKVNPSIMLPLVTCTVTSASGTQITEILPREYQLAMMIITTMLLIVAIFSSFVAISVLFTRFFNFGIPKNGASFTMFIPIGIMGQGGIAILVNSQNICNYYNVIDVVRDVGVALGAILSISLLALGVLFTVWGCLSVFYVYIGWPSPHMRDKLEVNMRGDRLLKWLDFELVYWTPTMWAATFPFATIALSSREVWVVSGISGFRVLSCIYGFAVIAITTWCMLATMLFVIPWELRHRKAVEAQDGEVNKPERKVNDGIVSLRIIA